VVAIAGRLGGLLLGALLAVAACGGQPQTQPTAAGPPTRVSPGPTVLAGCVPASEGRPLAVAGLTAVVLGTGGRGVVLSNQSDEDLCAWLPFARRLVARGYRVALWNNAGNPAAQLSPLVSGLRTAGAQSVVLVGASQGAKASLIAATAITPAVDGVVALSPEAALRGDPVAPHVARLAVPLLLVTAADDPYGSADACREFDRIAPVTDKRLLVLPGNAHGTALLTGSDQERVDAAVTDFLSSHPR